jgi:hypothetical protein
VGAQAVARSSVEPQEGASALARIRGEAQPVAGAIDSQRAIDKPRPVATMRLFSRAVRATTTVATATRRWWRWCRRGCLSLRARVEEVWHGYE